MKCTACGAELGPTVTICSYCGATTPFGLQQQHVHHHNAAQAHAFQLQREHEEAGRKRQEATRSLKRTADASLFWGIGGLVVCCALVPSAVALVLGVRARKMGAKYDLVIPTNATIGLILGILGIVSGLSAITFVVLQDRQRDQEISEIEAQLEGPASRAVLEHTTACLLARRSLLLGEFEEKRTIDSFLCDGKLLVEGDTAVLDDLRVKLAGTRYQLRVCYEKGQRWTVMGFRQRDASCEESVPAVSAKTPHPTTVASPPSAP